MRSAHVDPAAVDAGSVGFRLAPRINAAGRLGHPGAALELILTEDAEEARAARRAARGAEPRAAGGRGAGSSARPSPRSSRGRRRSGAARGYVIAGADWHEGVIGIVASRLVERYQPAGRADRRDGRAVEGVGPLDPAFDLHGGLAACAGHLERFGGHRAAAGLSIRPERGRGLRRRVRRARGRSPRRRGPRARHAGRRRAPARTDADARALRGAAAARAVRARQPRRHAARRGLRARLGSRPWARAGTCVPRAARRPRRRRRDRVRAGRPARPLPARAAATTSPSACTRTAGTARSRRSSPSGGSSTPTTASTGCATGSSPSTGSRPRRGTRMRTAIFAELELEAAGSDSGTCSNRTRSGPCSRAIRSLAQAA